MKTIFSLLFALTLGTAFGQFIPQPMGYNPDANGDEFIGVDDVMGTLALYDNAFDNGDSTEVAFFDLGVICSDDFEDTVVDESVDMLVIHSGIGQCGTEPTFILPQGPGFKSLMVLCYNYAETETKVDVEGFGQFVLPPYRVGGKGAFFVRTGNIWFQIGKMGIGQ